MPHSSFELFRTLLPWTINLLFYGSIIGIVFTSELPPVNEPVFLLREQFLLSNEAVFRRQDPGARFAIFSPYRPPSGAVSLLFDSPWSAEHNLTEQFRAAQSYLAPLVLNPSPTEKTAFFFCSRTAIARAQMRATGYRPVKVLGEGKIVAEKIS